MARKPPRPGSAAYNRLYGAGGGRGIYAVRPPLTRPVPAQTPAQVKKRLAPPAGPMRESPVRTTTPVRPAPAPASANPWDSYLAQIDAREKAARDEQIKMARARAMAYGESLSGFGQALQGNAAEQWGKVVDAYGRGAGEVNAYSGAAADSYTQGLINANQQIASDFATIGQEGPANIRDTDAARAQVETVGNTRPGETMGLVGKAWGSYGETRPGTLGFMTQQNIMQSQRQAMEQEQQIASEFASAMADNPQQAMQMWGAVEEWKAAKSEGAAKAAQLKLENARYALDEKRKDQAWQMTVQEYNLKAGKQFADEAYDRGQQTGTVWVYNPNTQRLENTGVKTIKQKELDEKGRAAKAREANAREANRIRSQNNKAVLAAKKADKTGTGGLTSNQLIIRENGWIKNMTDAVEEARKAMGAKQQVPKKAMVNRIYALVGGNLEGQAPRWTQAYLKSLILAYLNTLSSKGWIGKAKDDDVPTL